MSKLDELKEKFEGFVEEIKSKIPSKKKSDDDEDFDDEFDEATGQVEVDPDALVEDEEIGEQTLVDTDDGTQTEVEVDPDGSDDEDDEEEDEDDEEEKKKKQKSLIIKGLLGVVLLYLVFDTFMGGDSNELPPPPQNQVKKKKRPPRKKRPRRNRKAKVDKKAEQAKEQQAKAPEPTPSAPVATPAAPAATPVAPKVETPAPTPAPKVVATPTAAPKVTPPPAKEEVKIQEPVKMEAQAIPPETPEKPMDQRLGEKKVTKVENALAMDEKVDEILTKSVKEQMANVKKEEIDENGLDANMTYVEPPNYRRVGRGLIYNCVGRHWACVDKFAYFQCRENTKWSKVNQKEPECVVSNVYASEKDCGVVQLHYINTNEPTDFCEGTVPDSAENQDSAPKTKVVVP